MRYFFLFISLICFTTNSVHAVTMTGEGVGSGDMFISWKDLMSLSQQVKALNSQVSALRTASILGFVCIGCVLTYMHYAHSQEKLKIDTKSNLDEPSTPTCLSDTHTCEDHTITI